MLGPHSKEVNRPKVRPFEPTLEGPARWGQRHLDLRAKGRVDPGADLAGNHEGIRVRKVVFLVGAGEEASPRWIDGAQGEVRNMGFRRIRSSAQTGAI